MDLGMIKEGSAGDGAGADGDNDLRRGHGVIGFLECKLHVVRDWSGNQQTIGVTRRGDKLNAESSKIKDYRVEDVDICFARVTAAGADLPQFQ
jgi:hypothetical protein